MKKTKSFALSALSVAVAASLYACGGGGGGSDTSPASNNPPATVTLSGLVSAPGSIASAANTGWGDKLLNFFVPPAFAELLGLQAVSGATVSIWELNPDGSKKGSVALFTATTNSAGEYSFTNSAINPGSRYLIEVTWGSGNTMRAPLFGPAVNVNPGTEAVVQQVLTKIAGDATISIDNFTASELSALVAFVVNSGIDLTTATTINDAVNAISNDGTLNLAGSTNDMSGAGDTTTLAGEFHHVGKYGGFELSGFTMTAKSGHAYNGTVSLNNGLGAFTVGSGENHLLSITPTSMTLPPTFNIVPSQVANGQNATFSYYEDATHNLILGSDSFGASAADGSLFVITGFWNEGANTSWADMDFDFGGKKLAAAPDLTGKNFHLIGLGTEMGSYAANTAEFDTTTYVGSINYTSNTSATASLSINTMYRMLDDTIGVSPLETPSGLPISVAVGNVGALTMTHTDTASGTTTTFRGFVTGAPGNYIGVMEADDNFHQESDLFFTIEKSTNASLATLNGTYNIVAQCVNVWDNDGSPNYNGYHELELGRGTISFDGLGNNGAYSGNNYAATFTPGSGQPSITIATTPQTGASGTYTVASDGTLTFGQNKGAVSADGKTIVMVDESSPDYRCLYVGLRQ